MPTSTKVNNFNIHVLTQAQYDGITKAENDLYLITDDVSIPTAPTDDGTYVLKCVVTGGVATYSWVKEG